MQDKIIDSIVAGALSGGSAMALGIKGNVSVAGVKMPTSVAVGSATAGAILIADYAHPMIMRALLTTKQQVDAKNAPMHMLMEPLMVAGLVAAGSYFIAPDLFKNPKLLTILALSAGSSYVSDYIATPMIKKMLFDQQ